MNWKNHVPAIGWISSYNRDWFKGDLAAGLTVGVMLIPQGMAYAMLAGLPPIYGLYASILPLIIYAFLGTSRQLAVGPVAMVALLIAAGVGGLADPGTAEYIELAIVLALLVGLIQFFMGIFRLGFLVNFLSHPVISGFTSAAALVIGFSQLKHLLGVPLARSNYIHEIIAEAFTHVDQTNLYTFGIGILAIFIILMIRKWKLKIPGPLVAVIFGVLAVWLLGLDGEGVKIVGEVPEGLPALSIPNFHLAQIKSLLPIALAISFIGFMESIAVGKAIQVKHNNYKIVPNQELIALGLANIGGSLLQAFPVTGGFSRTAVNDQAGAKTGMAAIISAALIVLTLLFLTPLFYYLPQAILASVIMVAVFGLIDYKEAIRLWKYHRSDFWMLAVTFIGTLTLGIEEGVLIGVLLSLAMMIYQTTMPHIAVLGKIPGKPHYRNIDRFTELETRSDVLIVRFDARLYYANVAYFQEEMEQHISEKGKNLKLFILDADSMNGMDSTGVHVVEELYSFCQKADIRMMIVGAKGPLRDVMERASLFKKLGEQNFFFRIQHAIDAFDKQSTHQYEKYALQSNED